MRSLTIVVLLLAITGCAPAVPSGGPAAPASAPAAAAPAEQPAWQAEWDRLVAGARQEGRVTVYGPPGDQIRNHLTTAFQAAFPGITLELTGGRCAELTARMEAERRANLNVVDIYLCGTTTANTQVKPMGALQPIPPALILPEVTDAASWLGNHLEYSDQEGQFNLVFATTPKAFVAYDPRQVRPEDVDELSDLLDPRWKGKIAIGDPVPAGASQTVFRWFWHALGPEQGAEYIRALRGQAAAVDRDARRMVEWVARGRYPILVGPNDSMLQQLKMEGLDVEVVGTFKGHGAALNASYGTLMLIDPPAHPNAARVFANWLLTKEGQTAYSHGINQASRRLDVPTNHLPPETVTRADEKYFSNYTEENATMPPALVELLRDQFGR